MSTLRVLSELGGDYTHREPDDNSQSMDSSWFSHETKITPRSFSLVGNNPITLLRLLGLKQVTKDISWTRLALCLLMVYIAFGFLAGLSLQASSVENSAPMLRWWTRGFFLLFVDVQWTVELNIQLILTTLWTFCGSIGNLCLFGIVYDKFSQRTSAMVFARKVMLSRLPPELGGYSMLTFRYAHLSGKVLVGTSCRLTIFKRVIGEDGDAIMVPLNAETTGDIALTSPVYFIKHIINEESPFFDASKPGRCSFASGFARMFLSLEGKDAESQEDHCGVSAWDFDSIVPDHKWSPVLTSRAALRIDMNEFEKFEPLPEAAWLVPGGVSRSEIGLPNSQDEEPLRQVQR